MQNNPTYVEDDEITLKELILKLKEFWKELWKNWLLIGLIALPFISYYFYKAYTEPITYPAKLTFMVNEDEGNSLGGVASILGSFGIRAGARSEYNLEKILQLSKTRKIIQDALFEKVSISLKEDYYINHIIHLYEFHEKWEDDTSGLAEFVFQHNKLSDFNRIENKALQKIHKKIIGDVDSRTESILSSSISEETGIIQ